MQTSPRMQSSLTRDSLSKSSNFNQMSGLIRLDSDKIRKGINKGTYTLLQSGNRIDTENTTVGAQSRIARQDTDFNDTPGLTTAYVDANRAERSKAVTTRQRPVE